MVKIKYRLTIYYVNPDSYIYQNKYVKLVFNKFNSVLSIPHRIRKIYIDDIDKISINDLKPITTDFVIVIIPTRKYYFNIQTHADTTIVYLSFHPGNGQCSYGFYYPPLTIVRYFLLEGKLFSIDLPIYKRLKRDGRALLIACATVFKDISELDKLYERVLKKMNNSPYKNTLKKIIIQKRKKLLLDGGKYDM